MKKEVPGFLECGLRCQIMDVVPAIEQDAFVAIDKRGFCPIEIYVCQAAIDLDVIGGQASHSKLTRQLVLMGAWAVALVSNFAGRRFLAEALLCAPSNVC